MQLVPLLLNPPDAGITGHGDFDMDGNIELINTITGLNARSGGIITLNGGVHTITSIPGADGITENDPELRDLHNNDDYFLHFFGSNKTDTQNQSIQLICDTSSCKDQNDHFVNIAELPGENIWLSGNATIAANIGSEEQPVILVIDGDLVLAGDLEIWGLIYVTQSGHTVNVPGKVKIHGALMVESADIRASGNLVIAYDQNVLVPPKGGHGLFARVPGSWRDF
jgi:hypothetical protein